jgi:membrane-bound lytic murein transglycosylase D
MQSLYHDDRLDPEKATRAAARHLRDLYNRYGDWYLAVAAYNCGPGNVDKAIERTGYADFWELRSRRTLPLETTNYVPIILAMTIMAKNPREYEIEGVVPEPPIAYDVLEMSAPTHLALIADLTETPQSRLQALNPALLKSIVPKSYALRVPKGTSGSLASMLSMVPTEKRVAWRMHRVESGETVEAIGRRYGVGSVAILGANRLSGGLPDAGEMILIPRTYVEPTVKPVVRKAGARTIPAKRGPAASNRTRASAVRATSKAGARPHAVQTASARIRRE